MLKCPKCLSSYDDGIRFCAACGADLSIKLEHTVCPKCRTEFPAGTLYCNIDGIPLTEKKPIPRCTICGKEYPETANFCPWDGGRIVKGFTQPRANRTIIYPSQTNDDVKINKGKSILEKIFKLFRKNNP